MRRFWLAACLALTLLGSVSLASAQAQSLGYDNYRFSYPYGSNYWYSPGYYNYYYTPLTYARPYYYGPTYYPYDYPNYVPYANYYIPTFSASYYSAPAYSYWRPLK